MFPYVPNGNLYAPVMMLAEKAADLIAGNTPLAPEEVPFYRHRAGTPLTRRGTRATSRSTRRCRRRYRKRRPQTSTPQTDRAGRRPLQSTRSAGSRRHGERLWKVFGPGADKIVGTPDAELSRAELKRRQGASSA